MATRNSDVTTVTARAVLSGLVSLAGFGVFFGLLMAEFMGL